MPLTYKPKCGNRAKKVINQAIYNWVKKFEFNFQEFARIDIAQASQMKNEAKRQLIVEVEKLIENN